jgi:hypothetical protein
MLLASMPKRYDEISFSLSNKFIDLIAFNETRLDLSISDNNACILIVMILFEKIDQEVGVVKTRNAGISRRKYGGKHGIWRNITEYGGILRHFPKCSRNIPEHHDIFRWLPRIARDSL